jgi:hypothetical protein
MSVRLMPWPLGCHRRLKGISGYHLPFQGEIFLAGKIAFPAQALMNGRLMKFLILLLATACTCALSCERHNFEGRHGTKQLQESNGSPDAKSGESDAHHPAVQDKE